MGLGRAWSGARAASRAAVALMAAPPMPPPPVASGKNCPNSTRRSS